jgi:hypothetical protein
MELIQISIIHEIIPYDTKSNNNSEASTNIGLSGRSLAKIVEQRAIKNRV